MNGNEYLKQLVEKTLNVPNTNDKWLRWEPRQYSNGIITHCTCFEMSHCTPWIYTITMSPLQRKYKKEIKQAKSRGKAGQRERWVEMSEGMSICQQGESPDLKQMVNVKKLSGTAHWSEGVSTWQGFGLQHCICRILEDYFQGASKRDVGVGSRLEEPENSSACSTWTRKRLVCMTTGRSHLHWHIRVLQHLWHQLASSTLWSNCWITAAGPESERRKKQNFQVNRLGKQYFPKQALGVSAQSS